MPDAFDSAIRSLEAIALESAPRISITLDLTGFETGSHTGTLPAPELEIVHRPDQATDAETQRLMDVLSVLAQSA